MTGLPDLQREGLCVRQRGNCGEFKRQWWAKRQREEKRFAVPEAIIFVVNVCQLPIKTEFWIPLDYQIYIDNIIYIDFTPFVPYTSILQLIFDF